MAEASPHEFGFAYMQLGVAAPTADVRVAFLPLSDQHIATLVHKLRPKLAEPLPPMPDEIARLAGKVDRRGRHAVPVAPTLYPQIDIPGYPPLHAAIDRFGQTAILAYWIHRMTIEVATSRRNGSIQAVSLYLTGLDRVEDDAAIAAAFERRFGPQRLALPVQKSTWEKIAADPRPLAVQVFLQPLARLDPSIRCAFLALGAAFFGTLGVEGERDDEEEAPPEAH